VAQDDAKVRVLATLPDVGSIAKEVGGDLVDVTTLANGYEDPHYVTPTPALMTAVSKADLFLEIGLSLELWSERVLDGARNPKVRPGTPGHQYVSDGITPLDVPGTITRASGDLHPEGNPHVWLDPLNGLVMARNIRDALIRVAPAHTAEFQAGYDGFAARLYETLYGPELVKLLGGPLLARLDRGGKLMDFLAKKSLEGKPLIDRLGGLQGRARAFRGKGIIFYHPSWVYFADRFGVDIRGYVEDKPGIPPSAKHRDELIAQVKAEAIAVVAVTSYYPKRVPEAICEATGAKLVLLPNATGGVAGADSYLDFLKLLVDRLADAYGGTE
jgi:ABC-type Zn uptake system ZnuABC Zn-binding protein ZnuA